MEVWKMPSVRWSKQLSAGSARTAATRSPTRRSHPMAGPGAGTLAAANPFKDCDQSDGKGTKKLVITLDPETVRVYREHYRDRA